MIDIKRTASVSEKGKRQNNEDNHGFDLKHGVFIVCDGVGGVEKGEVASEQTVQSLLDILADDPEMDTATAVTKTESILSAYIQSNPDAMGMATTLTMTRTRRDGIEVSWIGDSRVYQFRDGQIIFRTEDHSWVNDAVRAGILTPEEAVNHPKSNIITRALQGNHKPTVPEVVLIRDLEPGDIILQCSDGVLESWTDNDLIALLNSEQNIDSILQRISEDCAIHSRDNYTALIYEIGKVNIIKTVDSPQANNNPDVTRAVRHTVASEINMSPNAAYRSVSASGMPPPKGGLLDKILSTKIPIVPSIIVVFTLSVGMYFFLLKPMMLPGEHQTNPKVEEKADQNRQQKDGNKKNSIKEEDSQPAEEKRDDTSSKKNNLEGKNAQQSTDIQNKPLQESKSTTENNPTIQKVPGTKPDNQRTTEKEKNQPARGSKSPTTDNHP